MQDAGRASRTAAAAQAAQRAQAFVRTPAVPTCQATAQGASSDSITLCGSGPAP